MARKGWNRLRSNSAWQSEDRTTETAMASTLAFLFGNKGVGGTCGWVRFRGEGLKGAEAVQPDSEF